MLESHRKKPVQQRSRQTVAAILEAATQILEAGDQPFTTNHVAARAGCSVGTLYQYFPDKASILFALYAAEREQVASEQRINVLGLSQQRSADTSAALNVLTCQLIATFAGRRTGWRRQMMVAALADRDTGPLALDDIAERIAKGFSVPPNRRRRKSLSNIEAYVLTRALKGLLVLAALENSPHMDEPEFHAAMLKLAKNFSLASESDGLKSAAPPTP